MQAWPLASPSFEIYETWACQVSLTYCFPNGGTYRASLSGPSSLVPALFVLENVHLCWEGLESHQDCGADGACLKGLTLGQTPAQRFPPVVPRLVCCFPYSWHSWRSQRPHSFPVQDFPRWLLCSVPWFSLWLTGYSLFTTYMNFSPALLEVPRPKKKPRGFIFGCPCFKAVP